MFLAFFEGGFSFQHVQTLMARPTPRGPSVFWICRSRAGPDESRRANGAHCKLLSALWPVTNPQDADLRRSVKCESQAIQSGMAGGGAALCFPPAVCGDLPMPARRDAPKAPAIFCPAAVPRLLASCLLYALNSRLYRFRPFVKTKRSRAGRGSVLLLSWGLGVQVGLFTTKSRRHQEGSGPAPWDCFRGALVSWWCTLICFHPVGLITTLVTVGFPFDDKPTVNSSRMSLMRSA